MDEALIKLFGDAYDPEAKTLRVKLGQKVPFNGDEVEEVTLCEPPLMHYEAAMKKPVGIERDRHLMAYIVGGSPNMFAWMPVSEYAKAMAFINFFAAGAPQIGESA